MAIDNNNDNNNNNNVNTPTIDKPKPRRGRPPKDPINHPPPPPYQPLDRVPSSLDAIINSSSNNDNNAISKHIDIDDLDIEELALLSQEEVNFKSKSTSSFDKTLQLIRRSNLNRTQLRAIKFLVEAEPNESQQSIADKVGVHRATLQRWLRVDEEFKNLYNALLSSVIEGAKGKTLQSLITGANKSWAGQPAMQKIFWSLAGMVSDRVGVEITGRDGGAVQVEHKIDADRLPMVVKKLIYCVAKGGKLSEGLERELERELDEKLMKVIGSNDGDDSRVIDV